MLADHPTPKPVQMLADAILDVTDRHDIVLDPFAGSGSTLMACIETDRVARLIERDPPLLRPDRQALAEGYRRACGA